jgi:hypothetical protein
MHFATYPKDYCTSAKLKIYETDFVVDIKHFCGAGSISIIPRMYESPLLFLATGKNRDYDMN